MLIKNVKIVTPYEILEDLVIRINHGEIVDINLEHLLEEDLNEEIIDGGGDYLSPGFIDNYNQENLAYDIINNTVETLDKIGEDYLTIGVTSYLVTIVACSYDYIIKAMEKISNYKNKKDNAKLIGIHLKIPFFIIDKNDIEKILKISKGNLRMVSLGPEQIDDKEVIEILNNNKVAVETGKSRTTFENAKIVIEQGAILDTVLSKNLDGSTSNIHEAVYNMVKYLDIPIDGAVKMVSLNPAKAINMGREIGSIRVGKRADLILFDEKIKIKHIIIGGNLIW